jgi:glycosyltransferase involved in cell wall biosynthesis
VDVVHAHDWPTFPAGRAAARRAGVPFVAHVHATEYDRCPRGPDPHVVRVEREGLDAADLVLTVSRYTARALGRRYGVDPAKVRIVPNGLDAPLRRPAARPRPRRGRDPVVLFLGRITAQKGPARFLEAAEIVARAEPRARFVMAGTGDLFAAMVERSAERGLGDRLRFTGFLEGADVARAYRGADVFAMPSVSEPFGIAALEAVAHGVPVVLSRRSGVAEVLPSAVRVDPRDAGALARAILDVLRDPAGARRRLARTRREAAALRWGASAGRLLDAYAEVLA